MNLKTIFTHPGVGQIDTSDWEALAPWLPVLGPTATIALHRIARLVQDGHTEVDMDLLACDTGVMPSVYDKALRRLVMYGMAVASADGTAFSVRAKAYPPTPRMVAGAVGTRTPRTPIEVPS